jgi:hypothetical protein
MTEDLSSRREPVGDHLAIFNSFYLQPRNSATLKKSVMPGEHCSTLSRDGGNRNGNEESGIGLLDKSLKRQVFFKFYEILESECHFTARPLGLAAGGSWEFSAWAQASHWQVTRLYDHVSMAFNRVRWAVVLNMLELVRTKATPSLL